MQKMSKRDFLLLHAILLLYSVSGILSKFASQQEFLSLGFILFYGGVLCLLFLYAVLWQQVLKKIPLTTAFANKAIVLVWGILWGVLFFHETIRLGKVLGALVIGIGIYVVVTANE